MPMNPLTLMMSRGMQVPAAYAQAQGPERFDPSNMWMQTPGGQYAGGIPPIPPGVAEQDEMAAVKSQGWQRVADFLAELKPHAASLPPQMQMKFSKLWEMVESQALENRPEHGDAGTADMAAHYGPSAAPLQGFIDDLSPGERDGPPGSENWDEGQWDEWEEQQDEMNYQQLQSILRGYGKR